MALCRPRLGGARGLWAKESWESELRECPARALFIGRLYCKDDPRCQLGAGLEEYQVRFSLQIWSPGQPNLRPSLPWVLVVLRGRGGKSCGSSEEPCLPGLLLLAAEMDRLRLSWAGPSQLVKLRVRSDELVGQFGMLASSGLRPSAWSPSN